MSGRATGYMGFIPRSMDTLVCRRPPTRVRSHGRFVLRLIHFIPDSLRELVPLFLKRQCDRALSLPPPRTLPYKFFENLERPWQFLTSPAPAGHPARARGLDRAVLDPEHGGGRPARHRAAADAAVARPLVALHRGLRGARQDERRALAARAGGQRGAAGPLAGAVGARVWRAHPALPRRLAAAAARHAQPALRRPATGLARTQPAEPRLGAPRATAWSTRARTSTSSDRAHLRGSLLTVRVECTCVQY